MVSKSDWLKDVSEGVPGCDKITVEKEVMNTIRDFCATTLLWVKELTAINIIAGTSTYTLAAPAGVQASVVSIERAECNDRYMDPESMDLLDRGSEMWRDQTGSESPSYMVDSEKVLKLRYIPTENLIGGLIIWASLKPTVAALTIPDFVYDDWYDAIKFGSWGRIFKIPKKAWTNIREGEYFESMYHEQRSHAKKEKRTGKTKLSLAIMPRPFSAV
jgi:hypothetical protein